MARQGDASARRAGNVCLFPAGLGTPTVDVATLIVLALVVAAFIAILRSLGGPARPLPSPADYEASRRGDRQSSELQKVWVRHIVDGDTVIVSGFWSETWIRLAHIDCPEDGQEWGNIATAGLIKMIGGRHVHLETHGIDVYGRTLATIYVQHSDGQLVNVNERMVMLGHAWVARQYYQNLPERRKQQYNRLEGWAKSKRVGLWRTSNPIPPWEWRNGK